MMAAQKYDLVVQKNFLMVIEQAIFIFFVNVLYSLLSCKYIGRLVIIVRLDHNVS